jgi:choline-sulfatase
MGQRRVATNASLVDIFPTVLDAFDIEPAPADTSLPGRSLLQLAAGAEHTRTMFSEYHAVGSASAGFMLAHGRFKYHHYVGYPPELFDLQDDPQEEHDLSASSDHRDVLQDCEARLRAIVDPQAVDRRAKDDQNAVVERSGGREAALRQGKIGATPVPSTPATKG